MNVLRAVGALGVILLIGCGDPAGKGVDTPSISSVSATIAESSAATVSLYYQSCISCHASGAAGAPRVHDLQAWQPRLAKGMTVLLENSKNGIGAMPPKGMCSNCSDADLIALIEFMSAAKAIP